VGERDFKLCESLIRPFGALLPVGEGRKLLSLFGGKPVMAHMVKTGHLTLDDVKEAEQELRRLAAKKEKAR